MKSSRSLVILIGLTLMGSGCAAVKTDQEWRSLKTRVMERTGQDLIWEQTENQEAIIKKEVNRLLTEGLTRDEAVQVALINNRSLQSVFEEIGISKADLIQAGLLHNPTISAFFRFALSGSGTNVESEGSIIPLSDLWQMPFRKKVASAQLEATMKRIEQAVLDIIRDTKKAYASVRYLEMAQKSTESLLHRFSDISGEIKKRKEFGFVTDLDLYLAGIAETEAETTLFRIESELSMAKSHLDRLLGLIPSQAEVHVKGDKNSQVPPLPNLETAIEHAIQYRLDAQIAQLKIIEAERKLELEKLRIVKELNLGASYEREVDGDEVLGPGIDIQLPLFDQNQAQIAKAQYKLRRAKKQLQALESQVSEEISHDFDRIHQYRKTIQLFSERMIPLRQRAVHYAQQWVEAMQLNRLYLLEAQKGMMQTKLDYLDAQIQLSHAVADLEHHLGGTFPL